MKLTLFGTFGAEINDKALSFRSNKIRALLAYLAVNVGPHRRETLINLLWGEFLEKSARQNLSVSLNRLRKSLAPVNEGTLLVVTRQTVQLNLAPRLHSVDVLTFDRLLLQCHKHSHASIVACAACLKRLGEAVALYQGHFMSDLTLPDSPAFNDWRLLEEESRLRQVIEALETLAASALSEGQPGQAESYARRQLALLPWQENAHRQLMRALAEKEQQTAALAQYQRCRQILLAELGVEPDEETKALYGELKEGRRSYAQVKQKEEPKVAAEALKRAELLTYIAEGEPNEQASRVDNLPAALTPLIGRQTEIKQLTTLLKDSTCRLLTLVGLGGIGKTELALAAARQLRETRRDGLVFVSLVGLDGTLFDPTILLIDKVLSALQEANQVATTGSLSPAAMLQDILREKELLLLLDNFEPLHKSAPLLTKWLADAPGLSLLITSRERLDLHGESVIEVQGLSSPPVAEGLEEREFSTREALASPALQLFTWSAKRVESQFKLSQQNISAVVRICQLVGGMPLALELAAAWVRLLPCEQIAQQIQANLAFLKSTRGNIPARHRNIEAVFEYTWAQLEQAEQEVLANLSVFAGTFSRAAMTQIVYSPNTPLLSRLQIESSLLDQALIQITNSKRIALHPLLSQYARQKLSQRRQSDDAASVHEQHSAYYAAFVQAQQQQANVQAIEGEIENIRVAWVWAVSQGQFSLVGQLVKGLYRFYHDKGRYEEGEAVFQRAVVELDLEPHSPQQQLVIAQLGCRLGVFCGYLGKPQKATSLLQSSLDISSNLNAREDMAFGFRRLSALSERNIFKNEIWLNEALALYHEQGDKEGIAATLQSLGMQQHLKGDYQQARQYLAESLSLCRQVGYQIGIANLLRSLGNLSSTLGEIEQAYHYHQESLRLARALNNHEAICYALRGLIESASIFEGYQRVDAYIEEALQREKQSRNQAGIALTYFSAGLAGFFNGEVETALKHFETTLPMLRRLNEFLLISITLSMLGFIANASGHQLKAGLHYQEALQLAVQVSSHPGILLPILGIAVLLASKNQVSQSVELLTLVINHPISGQALKDGAKIELAKIEAQMKPHLYAAAQERGLQRSLEEAAQNLLRSESVLAL